jgi:hypothetical protein
LTAHEQYRLDLDKQIAEKKAEKEREKAKFQAQDDRDALNAEAYNPWSTGTSPTKRGAAATAPAAAATPQQAAPPPHPQQLPPLGSTGTGVQPSFQQQQQQQQRQFQQQQQQQLQQFQQQQHQQEQHHQDEFWGGQDPVTGASKTLEETLRRSPERERSEVAQASKGGTWSVVVSFWCWRQQLILLSRGKN